MKRVISLFLLAALLFCGGCGRGEPREADVIVEEILTAYSEEPEASQAELKTLFRELKSSDREKAELWGQILDFWKSCDDSPVYENELPEGLPGDDSLCLVVLGFKLKDDGSMQDELIGRLEVALHCAEQYPNAYVLCSGGGTAANDPNVTEAGQMGAWMTSHGLDESRLLTEERAGNTVENARFSYELLQREKPQVHSLAIITSSYHVVRGSVLYESVLLMTNGDTEAEQLHVVSNAAYPVPNGDAAGERTRLVMQLKSLLN